MIRPLSDYLKNNAESGPLPMYMPGHKRNYVNFPWLKDIGIDMDITEITGADDLNDPEGFFAETERIAAETWHSRHSFPLVGGSTAGILAAMYAMTKRGDPVLIARNCHRSVYNAVELLELYADYVNPQTDGVLGVYTRVTPESVKLALEKHRASLVVITSPTYEGFISDVGEISAVCHFYGARLLVDEAHGAHLGFGGFPAGALSRGADMVVQSLHKTLPSPTQTAMLHLNCEEPVHAVRKAICTFQSSSPSYLLSCGIDSCVRFMAERGESECGRLFDALAAMRGIAYPNDDPAKIVLPEGSYPGVEFEMRAPGYVIAYAGLGDTEGSISELRRAAVSRSRSFESRGASFCALPERAVYPFECGAGEMVPAGRAAGRVSAEYIWCYPPGSPLIVPGERITEELLGVIAGLIDRRVRVSSTRKGLPDAIYCLSSLDKRDK